MTQIGQLQFVDDIMAMRRLQREVARDPLANDRQAVLKLRLAAAEMLVDKQCDDMITMGLAEILPSPVHQ